MHVRRVGNVHTLPVSGDLGHNVSQVAIAHVRQHREDHAGDEARRIADHRARARRA